METINKTSNFHTISNVDECIFCHNCSKSLSELLASVSSYIAIAIVIPTHSEAKTCADQHLRSLLFYTLYSICLICTKN